MKLLQILIQYTDVLKRRDVCGCWLWKTAIIDHQGMLQDFAWGIELRCWRASSEKMEVEDYLFICVCKLICHNLNNQDFRELLEYV